jgi:hypothetical protein
MKKVKMLLAALLLSVATFSGYKAYQAYSISQDDLLMQNLEALADGESGDIDGAIITCDKEPGTILDGQCWSLDKEYIPTNFGEPIFLYTCKFIGSIGDHCSYLLVHIFS